MVGVSGTLNWFESDGAVTLTSAGTHEDTFNYYPLSSNFPVISVPRGGIRFSFEPESPQVTASRKAFAAHIERLVGDRMQARTDAIDNAARYALDERQDVHLYDAPYGTRVEGLPYAPYRFFGVGFTPAQQVIPMLVEHRDFDDWEG